METFIVPQPDNCGGKWFPEVYQSVQRAAAQLEPRARLKLPEQVAGV